MDTPLSEHIIRLERKVESLTEEVMRNRLSQTERNRVDAELRAANLALSHYKAALKLEEQLHISN